MTLSENTIPCPNCENAIQNTYTKSNNHKEKETGITTIQSSVKNVR